LLFSLPDDIRRDTLGRDFQSETTQKRPMQRREQKDRRKKPTPILSRYTFLGGRRLRARREEDRQGGYYIDQYGSGAFILFCVVILFNALDGFLAFYMLHALHGVDNLPLSIIREMGGEIFILAAFILGSFCALFLFLHKNFPVARLAIGLVILFQLVTISAQLILILFFHAT